MKDIAKAIILGVVLVLWLAFAIFVFTSQKIQKTNKNIVKFMVRVAVFGGISIILYTVPMLKFPVPFFPSFLEFHFDEIPIFIAGFAYGPWTAAAIILIKFLVKIPFTSTMVVGEISDLIYSTAFIIPAAIIYQKHRKFSSALSGILIGTVFQIVTSVVTNVYLMIPFYMFVMDFPEQAILAMCQAANANVTDVKWSYGLLCVLPFNVIKDAIVIIVTLLVYKATHKLIDKLA